MLITNIGFAKKKKKKKSKFFLKNAFLLIAYKNRKNK